jgi:hypothetical protein
VCFSTTSLVGAIAMASSSQAAVPLVRRHALKAESVQARATTRTKGDDDMTTTASRRSGRRKESLYASNRGITLKIPSWFPKR